MMAQQQQQQHDNSGDRSGRGSIDIVVPAKERRHVTFSAAEPLLDDKDKRGASAGGGGGDVGDGDGPDLSWLISQRKQPEARRVGVTKATFFLLGVGCLMPWNAVLTSLDFFRGVYPSHQHPDLYFTMLFQLATLLMMIALVFYGTELVFQRRFLVGYSVYIVLLAALPLLSQAGSTSITWPLVLGIMPLFGLATGLVESSVYGYAGLTGHFAVTFTQAGESASGLLVTIIQMATKAAFPSSKTGVLHATYTYFGLSMLVCFSCLVAFCAIPWLRNENSARDTEVAWHKAHQAMRENKWMCIMVCLNYIVTLAIFPGLVVSVPSAYGITDGWFPIILIFIFNFGDASSRLMCNFRVICLRSELQVSIACLLRVAFLPVFVLFVKGVIVQDIACMVLTLALGWTNGYVSVNSWQHGRHALSKSTKEVGGYIQTLAMALGITLGVVLALATNKIANPASV